MKKYVSNRDRALLGIVAGHPSKPDEIKAKSIQPDKAIASDCDDSCRPFERSCFNHFGQVALVRDLAVEFQTLGIPPVATCFAAYAIFGGALGRVAFSLGIRPGKRTGANQYVNIGLPTGSGKSYLASLATALEKRHQKSLDAQSGNARKWRCAQSRANRRKLKLTDQMAKESDPAILSVLEDEWIKLDQEIEECDEEIYRKSHLIVDRITSSGMLRTALGSVDAAMVFSPEGGWYERKMRNAAKGCDENLLDYLLSGYSGEWYRRHSGGPISGETLAHFSLLILSQPDPILEVFRDENLLGRGFSGRVTTIHYDRVEPGKSPQKDLQALLKRWDAVVDEALDHRFAGVDICHEWSSEALTMFDEFEGRVQQRISCDYPAHREYFVRVKENAARVALCALIMDNLLDGHPGVQMFPMKNDRVAAERAISMMDWYVNHALGLLTSHQDDRAEALRNFIAESSKGFLTMGEIKNNMGMTKQKVFDIVGRHPTVFEIESSPRGKAGRPTQRVRLKKGVPSTEKS